MINERISIQEEVDVKIFNMQGDLLMELEMIELKINIRNGNYQWDIEFYPDFYAEEAWNKMVYDNEIGDVVYRFEFKRRNLVREGFGTLRGKANNPCKMTGTTKLKLKK